MSDAEKLRELDRLNRRLVDDNLALREELARLRERLMLLARGET